MDYLQVGKFENVLYEQNKTENLNLTCQMAFGNSKFTF